LEGIVRAIGLQKWKNNEFAPSILIDGKLTAISWTMLSCWHSAKVSYSTNAAFIRSAGVANIKEPWEGAARIFTVQWAPDLESIA
jgi:hypothetical protein